MTVGVGYRVPGLGAVLVSDGRITHDGEITTDTARKHVICGATPVLLAGDVGPSWSVLQTKPPRTFAALRKAIETAEDDTDWLAYDRGSDRLWLGHLRLGARFAALGCGASLALGALEALTLARTLEDAAARAEAAVRVAVRRHAHCGGRVRVLVCPRRGAIRVA